MKLRAMTTYRVCFCFYRKFSPVSTEAPEAIKEVFVEYSENGVMGAEQLQRFLAQVQGESEVTKESAQGIIDGQREHKHLNNVFQIKKGLSLNGFFRYLFGDTNPPIDPSPRVHQDMDAPLSHYFIYTGHNSYLTGNQLSSDSSDVPIIKALKRGVRVIELDLWPNNTKTDVEVRHGRTLTAPVELIKCLESIKEHAFTASKYPVIITLEDHLTPDLQAKVAKMLKDTFEDLLFYPESDNLEKFPSPEYLKMKIVVSTKPPKELHEPKTLEDKDSNLSKYEDEQWGAEVGDLKSEINAENKIEHDHREHFGKEENLDDGDQVPHSPVAPEYKSLIAISAKKREGELSDYLKVDPDKVTRLSLSEQVLEKAVVNHGTELIRFTQRNLLRIYPKVSRVTSSNYNPVLGWMYGAQMVALNMQGKGRPLWLMQGMFRANGGCGYVKKPDMLLFEGPHGQVFDPKAKLAVKKTLKVRVYMGDGWRFDFRQTHFDKFSPPDFYTRVGISGVEADTTMQKTKAIEDNWTPFWDEEFTFPLTTPELALLRVEVHEYDMNERDDFGGQTCLPVWELRSGIRSVELYDRRGDKFKSVRLLMSFDFV